MVIQNVNPHSFPALLFQQPGQGCSGLIIPEDIELKTDEFLGSADRIEDGLEGFLSPRQQLNICGDGESVFKDSFDGFDKKSSFHSNALQLRFYTKSGKLERDTRQRDW